MTPPRPDLYVPPAPPRLANLGPAEAFLIVFGAIAAVVVVLWFLAMVVTGV